MNTQKKTFCLYLFYSFIIFVSLFILMKVHEIQTNGEIKVTFFGDAHSADYMTVEIVGKDEKNQRILPDIEPNYQTFKFRTPFCPCKTCLLIFDGRYKLNAERVKINVFRGIFKQDLLLSSPEKQFGMKTVQYPDGYSENIYDLTPIWEQCPAFLFWIPQVLCLFSFCLIIFGIIGIAKVYVGKNEKSGNLFTGTLFAALSLYVILMTVGLPIVSLLPQS